MNFAQIRSQKVEDLRWKGIALCIQRIVLVLDDLSNQILIFSFNCLDSPKVIKDFYKEHSAVTAMSEAEVTAVRLVLWVYQVVFDLSICLSV